MFCCDYFYPAYMLMKFSNYKAQFATYQALFTLCGGLFAALSGGFMAEKIGKRDPRNYARICAIGSLIAWPCLVVGVTSNNFWVAICMLLCRYAFGENYWSPNLQMLKNSCKSTEFGSYIGVYQFFCIMAGCFATIGTSYAANSLGYGQTAAGLGKVIASVVSIGYSGSIACWWLAANLLKKRADSALKGFIINPPEDKPYDQM